MERARRRANVDVRAAARLLALCVCTVCLCAFCSCVCFCVFLCICAHDCAVCVCTLCGSVLFLYFVWCSYLRAYVVCVFRECRCVFLCICICACVLCVSVPVCARMFVFGRAVWPAVQVLCRHLWVVSVALLDAVFVCVCGACVGCVSVIRGLPAGVCVSLWVMVLGHFMRVCVCSCVSACWGFPYLASLTPLSHSSRHLGPALISSEFPLPHSLESCKTSGGLPACTGGADRDLWASRARNPVPSSMGETESKEGQSLLKPHGQGQGYCWASESGQHGQPPAGRKRGTGS